MLKKVLSERDRSSVFQVPADLLDNPSAINERVAAVPKEIQSALKLVLSYLFETEGPTNLIGSRSLI